MAPQKKQPEVPHSPDHTEQQLTLLKGPGSDVLYAHTANTKVAYSVCILHLFPSFPAVRGRVFGLGFFVLFFFGGRVVAFFDFFNESQLLWNKILWSKKCKFHTFYNAETQYVMNKKKN